MQGELGTFASNRQSRDFTVPGKILLAEQERCVDAAVVQPAVAERLVEVKIYTSSETVVQDEVPRTIAGPRMDPIDSLL
jgi:hypothetical protein